jgi:hypothetical protein
MSASHPSALRSLSVLLVMLASCDRGAVPEGTDPAPALLLQDSVELQDPSSGPVGKPGVLVVLGDGGYLLADVMTQRVLEYDAGGAHRRVIGGKGGGPGEFQRLGPIALDGDSMLYVLDGTTLNVLDYRTGEYREKTTLPAFYSQSIVAEDGKLYFRALDAARIPHMSGWGHEGVVEGPALPSASELEAVKATGATEIAQMMNTTHSWAVFGALEDDRIAVLSQSSEDVLVATLGGIEERIPVARTQRQGVRADVLAQMATDPNVTQGDPQLVYTPSIPVAVARNSAGQYISIKADYTFLTDHFAVKLYLSVSDPRTGLTCPDARVPGPEDPVPSLALRGDTLLVLSHEIRGAAAVPLIRKYLIRTSACRWVKPGAA